MRNVCLILMCVAGWVGTAGAEPWEETMFLGLDSVPSQFNQLGRTSAVADGWAIGSGGGSCAMGCIGVFERISPGEWVLRQQITPGYGFFPTAVAMSPGRVIVGTDFAGGAGMPDAGRAAIFELESDGVWREAALLAPAELVTNSRFGRSVAIDGDRAIVLAKAAFTGFEHVKAFIFERSAAGEWSLDQSIRLVDFQGQDRPSHVAIAGDSVAVLYADFSKNNVSVASVRWYERGAGGWEFNGEQQITAAKFGIPWIGMTENVTVLSFGGVGIDGLGDGGLLVYRRDPDGEWTRTQAIENLVSEPFSFSQSFGFDGTTIAVGVNSFPASENTVLLFRADAEGLFSLEQAVTSAFFLPGENVGFGASLGVDGRDLVVGVSAAWASTVLPDIDRGQLAFFDRTADEDTDGDGLADDWEQNGIPFERADGTIGRVVLPRADPLRKNMYIEVDAALIPVPEESMDLVVEAFDRAPVVNPDGSTGIILHIALDENGVATPDSVVVGDNFPNNFAALRSGHFGTAVERADPDAVALLAAKAKAYRWCFAYSGIQFPPNRAYFGRGELPGVNFLIDLDNDLFDVVLHPVTGPQEIAATFMHEFGHTLGLRHGGNDNIHGKPNYPSVMNYALTHIYPWNRGFRRLDFSREDLGLLDESALDESRGVNSAKYRRFRMPFGTGEGLARRVGFVRLSGRATDFDGDGVRGGVVSEDLNFIPGVEFGGVGNASPDQDLPGRDDWSTILYAPTASRGGEQSSGCTNPTVYEFMSTQIEPPCAPDFNDDGLVNFFDMRDFLVAFNAGDLEADLAEPFDVLNFYDIARFVQDFAAGCP